MDDENINPLIETAAEKWVKLVDIGWRLRKKKNNFRSASEHKISQRQFKILVSIEFAGINTVSDLAKAMALSKSTMSIITTKMIKSGYIEKKRPTISQDKRQVFFKVTETGFNILKAQTEKNIAVFRDFYNEISESQRENFRNGVKLLRELSPTNQQCTEALVKKYTKDFTDDDEFLSVLEDLSYFSFSILDRNAKEFSSVCTNPKNELKALTEHQLQIIFCVRVLELDTISKLSEFLGASSSTLSIAVSKLVNMGYLRKTYPDMDSDGRFVYIKPTDKTIIMFDEAYINAQRHIKTDMLKKLSDENLKKFISGMDYLLKVFE